MRKLRYAVLGLFVVVNSGLAGTSSVVLHATALSPVVRGGSAISVQVMTVNNSGHAITYRNTAPDCDYSVKVWTSSGALATETAHKKSLVGCSGPRITGRDFMVTLKPGESNDDRLEVSGLYDMSIPDKYSVQVGRAFPQIGQLRSNTVIVEVTP